MDGLTDSGPGFSGVPGLPFGAHAAMLAHNWWAVALRGVLGIAFGLMALAWPGVTLATLILLFGAYMAVDGVFAIIAAARAAAHHQRWGMLIVEGIVDLIAAAIAFTAPVLTLLAFIYLLAVWAVISGVLLGWASFRLHPAHGRWFMLFGGIVSVLWGGLLFALPIEGALVMAWWLGAYAIVFGIVLLVLAFRLRRVHQGVV
jgi:uncharacterized membrane protein HdeD (DUF308 family)